MFLYTVRPGDSLYSITRTFNTTEQPVIDGNQLRNPSQLVIGQSLVIPVENVRHTVAPGENLSGISRLYQIPADAILQANPEITNPSFLRAGQILIIPSPMKILGTKRVNGYAFPSVNLDTLKKVLPWLTYCSIFSYRVSPDGSLDSIADEPAIHTARGGSTAPIMVITNIRAEGGFSSDLAQSVLSSDAVQNLLLDNILRILKEKGYIGLNIDFEYVYPQDRQAYNNFVQKAAAILHPAGYILTTSLAPKTSAGQRGLLYEAHDYPVHGKTVDFVVLMTYEWGYTYGPARPVAPLNLVEQVIRYAVSVIPPEKILMGIPNYGYDWTLPFVRGTAAKPLTNPGAVELAARVGARILFDEKAQSPHFSYYSNGKRHEVWFEDGRSINAKLRLADRYGLGGVSYWTVNSYFAQNWLVMDSLYRVKKVIG